MATKGWQANCNYLELVISVEGVTPIGVLLQYQLHN